MRELKIGESPSIRNSFISYEYFMTALRVCAPNT